jgi:dienelactone hydrolase
MNLLATETSFKEIKYEYLGSYNAYMAKPVGTGPFPAIVYSYDEFIDWAGQYVANKRGYNLKKFASYFASQGYVVIIPLERYRKVNAVLGAIDYLDNQSFVQNKSIHLMGVSEGAFINLIALQKTNKIRSNICIAPIIINEKGYLSTNSFSFPTSKRVPILFLEARDVGWRINSQRKIYNELKKTYPNITYKTYHVKKRWFWFYHNRFMIDIHDFLKTH